MSTPPTPVSSATKLQTILAIISAALQGLTLVPGPVGAGAGIGLLFQGILKNALDAYHAEAGQPIDLSKIPLETPVP